MFSFDAKNLSQSIFISSYELLFSFFLISLAEWFSFRSCLRAQFHWFTYYCAWLGECVKNKKLNIYSSHFRRIECVFSHSCVYDDMMSVFVVGSRWSTLNRLLVLKFRIVSRTQRWKIVICVFYHYYSFPNQGKLFSSYRRFVSNMYIQNTHRCV